jgi:CBS domain-containing protein
MSVPVSAILERKGHEVLTASAQDRLADAARAMADRGVGALVVVDEQGAVEGIVSERDVVRRVAADGAAALEQRVEEVMTRSVTTCSPSTGATELASTMTEGRMRHLPVVEEGRLVGIVSIGDVVKSRLDELATQTENLERYVTGTAY